MQDRKHRGWKKLWDHVLDHREACITSLKNQVCIVSYPRHTASSSMLIMRGCKTKYTTAYSHYGETLSTIVCSLTTLCHVYYTLLINPAFMMVSTKCFLFPANAQVASHDMIIILIISNDFTAGRLYCPSGCSCWPYKLWPTQQQGNSFEIN